MFILYLIAPPSHKDTPKSLIISHYILTSHVSFLSISYYKSSAIYKAPFGTHIARSIYELLNRLLQSLPRIPSGVTMNGAFSEGRDGDLNMYAYLCLFSQYKITLFVQTCDQLSPVQN